MGRTSLRSSRLFLRALPVLVWLGTILCVVGLFHRRAGQFELVGIADAEVHDVGTNTRARLISVNVQLFKKVNKGDPVAVVNTVPDDERIDAEMATIQADIDLVEVQLTELRDNYVADVNNRKSEWWAEMRAFTADVVMATARIVDTNAVLETDLASLEKIELEIKNFTIEHGANLGTDIALYNQLQTMKANRDRQAEKIGRDKGVLDKYKKLLEEAEQRKKRYEDWIPIYGTTDEDAERVIYLAKEALERRKDELLARREKLVLTAPCDGFVSSIDSQIGEVVILPDFPVLSITEEKPSSIIAYVNENLAGHFTANKQVEIVKRTEPKQIGRSEITYIGPRVETLPTRFWTDLNIPRYGRLMQIEIPLGMKLIPGELVGIRVL